jgi:prolyl-tRNA editing enzyme YbaK/EbsC (Cys-tRNA(Pro) deacylase)
VTLDPMRVLAASDRALEDSWLTVQQFSRKYNVEPKYVYEAIRLNRFAFEYIYWTTGKRKRSIRIGPKKVA